MRILVFVICCGWLALSAPVATAQPAAAVDESYFVRTVFPLLHTAQCVRCHSDNGVASETSLEFPRADATEAQITGFGLALRDLVDTRQPEESLLLQKRRRSRGIHSSAHTANHALFPGCNHSGTL